MHPGELTITVTTVRALVEAQFPQWQGFDVERVASGGTVNALFRLGLELSARFPLEPDDPESTRQSLRAEAAAARTLLGRTPFATPEPVALGEPGSGYPLPWSVQTWVPGTPATGEGISDLDGLARDLADFIAGVQTIDTGGRTFAGHGHGRGGDLRSHDEWMEQCFFRSEQLLDVARLCRIWADLRELPRTDRDVMTHGDLIPGNILVAGGRLVGVIDVGGLGPADPALDLVCAWHLFDDAARQSLRHAVGCDDLQWERGKAWAFQQAMGLVWYYSLSHPSMSAMGRRTLQRIVADSA